MSRETVLRRLGSPLALVLLAVTIRLAFVISMGDKVYFADTAEYEAAAIRLLDGAGPGESTPRAPLFPAEMALGFLLGGRGNYFAVRMIQLALAALLSLLAMRIAGRLGGRSAATITGVVIAFAPTLVFSTGMLYPTLLYSTLLTGAVATALAADDEARSARGLLLGALLALAYLTDPVALAPAGVLLGWLAFQGRGRAFAIVKVLAAALLAMAAVLGPVTAWQKAASGGKTVFMQKAQYVLHYSRTDSTLAGNRWVRLEADPDYRPLATGEFLRQEWALLSGRPVAYVHDVAAEFLHFFQPLPDRIQTKNQYSRGPVLMLGAVYFLPVLLLAILGLLRGAGEGRRRLALALVVLATAAFYSLFFTQTRYRIPVEPALIVLAALGFARALPPVARALDGDGPARD